MIRDIFQDILKHANNSFFEFLKITSSKEETIIQADGSRTIILNAKTKAPITELKGSFGLGNLNYLKGLINFDPFKRDDATINVKMKTTGEKSFPEVIEFAGGGAKASYRLMHESTIPAMPVFNGTKWDVVFTPKLEKINEFAQLASLHAEVEEDQFSVKIVDGDLVFFIGEENSASHKAQMIFEEKVTGSLNNYLKWPIQQVLSTLKMGSGQCTIKLSQRGIICIAIDSGLVDYEFFIIANQK